MKMEAEPPQESPLPATLEPISRPSSTSTQASVSVQQYLPPLPAISTLATGALSATSSPQLRATNAPPQAIPRTSPPSTAGPAGINVPSCQNCGTQTTPLWRRDELGSVLCNACGLFLKLHGRPRPISLKTDVIKSRNRVKTMRPDLAKQKKNQGLSAVGADMNGADPNNPNGTPSNARRPSQHRPSNGHVDDTNSPISRTGTPTGMYNAHHGLPMYPGIEDPQFQTHGVPGFPVAPTDARAPSPLNGEQIPPTHESLLASNASLKTRVSELEVIQELYRSRLAELENEVNTRQAQDADGNAAESQYRSQLESLTESEAQLRKELEESHRRENNLKRRLDELELELKDAKESLESHETRPAKKARVDDEAVKEEAPSSEPAS